MKIKIKFFITLILLPFISQALFAEDKKQKEFRIPKSMVEATERRLSNEDDPESRLQLVLRWIRIKEEYEKTIIQDGQDPQKAENLLSAKKQIIKQLKTELSFFTQTKDLDYSQIYRELGFRTLELKQTQDSVYYFEQLSEKTPEDYLAYGDALIANKSHEQALQGYEKASRDPQLVAMSWYKRAWVYMQLNDFDSALNAFDKALVDNPHSTVQLREEAFKDRLKPFIETHKKPHYDSADDRELRRIINQLYAGDPEKVKKGYINTLENLIGGFNAKAQVDKARAVFLFLEKQIKDPHTVLVVAAPIWLKVYRSQLKHDQLEEIVRALPDKDISSMRGVDPLRAELNNTAVFYQTMAEDDNPEAREDFRKEANRLLVLTYAKYFQTFPLDKEVDPLRINYANILLDRGNAESCLDILKNRGGQDKEVEKAATNLEGKCEFKRLEELYAKPSTPEFFALLNRALFDIKLYERSDLGVSSVKVYESLVQMIFGSIKKDPKNEVLRKMLLTTEQTYPYKKTDTFYRQIQITIAELRFDDLIALKESKKEGLDEEFFSIYQITPKDTQVAEKSLTNSVLLGSSKKTLERCDEFQQSYPTIFTAGGEVPQRCMRLAERYLNLEKEYAYLKVQNVANTAQRQFRLLTIELALGDQQALRKIERLGTKFSHHFMNLWEGKNMKQSPPTPAFTRLKKEMNEFSAGLVKIKFSQIQKVVPQTTKKFERLEKRWHQFFNAGPASLWKAEALLIRSKIAFQMKEWMKNLPEPPGLTKEELEQYRTQAEGIQKSWVEKADLAKKECSEVSYSLSSDFKPTEDEISEFCPEETPKTVFQEFLTAWNETRQKQPERKPWDKNEKAEQFDIVADLIQAGQSARDKNRGKYFLIRAYDLADSKYYKARALLGLAKIEKKDSYWLSANALDGNLVEPIYWLKEQSDGNPFYEKLYSQQINVAER